MNLQFLCFQVPSSEWEWLRIAKDFQSNWNFNHCIGAIGGKHISLQAPAKNEIYYFNYNHYFSIVLLSLVDADYKFTYFEVWCNGRAPDGGVLMNCTLNEALINNYLYIPPPEPLEGEKS